MNVSLISPLPNAFGSQSVSLRVKLRQYLFPRYPSPYIYFYNTRFIAALRSGLLLANDFLKKIIARTKRTRLAAGNKPCI
jgi:hypothetical protein